MRAATRSSDVGRRFLVGSGVGEREGIPMRERSSRPRADLRRLGFAGVVELLERVASTRYGMSVAGAENHPLSLIYVVFYCWRMEAL